MRIAFLSLFLFSASIFVSPLPTAVSSETVTQDSGVLTPVLDKWLTEVAKSKNGKRIKIRYQLDVLGKPDWIRGFEYYDGGWKSGLSGKDSGGYYVYNIFKYYF